LGSPSLAEVSGGKPTAAAGSLEATCLVIDKGPFSWYHVL